MRRRIHRNARRSRHGPVRPSVRRSVDEGRHGCSLVAYSTPREAYDQADPDFQKTPGGNGVSFSQSYAASGDQARAVSRPA